MFFFNLARQLKKMSSLIYSLVMFIQRFKMSHNNNNNINHVKIDTYAVADGRMV